MDMGVYESLLTAKLFKQLTQDDDLRPEYGSVDEAEQALTIARHLAPIIERSLRAAGTAEERAELTRRILAVCRKSTRMARRCISTRARQDHPPRGSCDATKPSAPPVSPGPRRRSPTPR